MTIIITAESKLKLWRDNVVSILNQRIKKTQEILLEILEERKEHCVGLFRYIIGNRELSGHQVEVYFQKRLQDYLDWRISYDYYQWMLQSKLPLRKVDQSIINDLNRLFHEGKDLHQEREDFTILSNQLKQKLDQTVNTWYLS